MTRINQREVNGKAYSDAKDAARKRNLALQVAANKKKAKGRAKSK